MRMLNISISDAEYAAFGITNNVLSFSDFVDIVSKKLMRENLEAAISAAEISGLSALTMDDITAEVQALRQNAESNN
ncbi:MAG: hypothetical protein FWB82_07950 [Treponema sp.]|nr:hypothetical protein [Treponema sp.]